MEEKILKVIKKTREIFRYQKKYRDVLKQNPSVTCYVKNDKFVLWSIQFCDGYSVISINNKGIWYSPNRGNDEMLINFKSIDDFLEME